MRHFFYILSFWLVLTLSNFSLANITAVDDTSFRSTGSTIPGKCSDDPVVAMLDSLAHQKYITFSKFTTDRNKLNVNNFSEGYVPVYSAATYAERINKLDKQTPFNLVYNDDVKQFIDLYSLRKSRLTERIMGLSELYFPIFEQMLDKYNLPLELKYLAVIESALCPVAVSPAGAGGLWQFMYYTGKIYDLKVTSYVDERYDPYKATEAACKYLKYLYSLFHDWTLVIAAYNVGEGYITRTIRRAGGETDFWKIKRYLPMETRSYVPAFIAVNYVMNHAADHNIFPVAPNFLYYQVDTVKVSQTLRFDQLSEFLNIPYNELIFLNPAFKRGIIPASAEEPYTLRLPKKFTADFVNNELALYNYKTKQEINNERLAITRNKININGCLFEKHVVSYGENLQMIADEYGCTKENIKSWNKLKRDKLKPKETLLIMIKSDTAMAKADSTRVNTAIADSINRVRSQSLKTQQVNVSKTPVVQNIKHVVKNGESLGVLSAKYGTTIANLKKWNNLRNNFIYPKQILIVKQNIIYLKQESISVNALPKKDTRLNKESTILSKDTLTPQLDSTGMGKKINNQKNDLKNTNGSNFQQQNIKYIFYTIQSGDTLWSIAQKYKALTVDELKKINNLQENKSLVPGQKIKVGISS